MPRKKPTAKAPAPIPRRLPRVPIQKQHRAELWLDLFMAFNHEAETLGHLDHARILADRALEIFESRWPGVKL